MTNAAEAIKKIRYARLGGALAEEQERLAKLLQQISGISWRTLLGEAQKSGATKSEARGQ